MPARLADRSARWPASPGDTLQVGARKPRRRQPARCARPTPCSRPRNTTRPRRSCAASSPRTPAIPNPSPAWPSAWPPAGATWRPPASSPSARASSRPRRGCGWFALGYVHLLGSHLEEGWRCLAEGRRRDPDDPRLQLGVAAYEARRPGVLADLAPDNPLNRLLGAARKVATDHRVMTASAVYACYRAACLYFSLG